MKDRQERQGKYEKIFDFPKRPNTPTVPKTQKTKTARSGGLTVKNR